ncbi:glycosyltransferase family 4 protein [Gottfriedia sp. NPDC057991]|uniref:glycosyltransferase family 4 protein n=1 Tax=Gottfriedia sp. NPDC057991 TaxID=3346298 RepID=UPI0036DCDA73
MKIIMIGSHLRTTGGITRVIKNYLQGGLGDKVDLEFFPTYYGSNHIINILYFIKQYLKLYFNLVLFKKKYDIAHIHMSYRGSFIRKKYIIRLLNRLNIKIILHMHGSEFKDFFNESTDNQKKEIKDTLNKATIILALGEQWKKYYQTISKAHVISLDNAVFPKINNTLPEEKVYITTMGVLSNRKGTYDLIETALKIKGKIDPKYKFLIAGDGEVEKVKSKVKELNLEDLFIIPGWISDQEKIDEIYRKSIIYVLPSYNEGMPMSILEAMSYGLPIISTNVGSISSVVEEDNGFIINPGDTEILVNLLIDLLNDQSKIKLFEENNRNKISEKYNVYVSLDKIVSLYKSIL